MANVLVNNVSVNKQQRNKRNYCGSVISNNINNSQFIPTEKVVIEFTSDAPTIPDYSIYADIYGQYPTIGLFTIDEFNNRIERPEKPYFHMVLDTEGVKYIIDSIEFGTLSDGVQTGFITLSL